MRNSIDSGDFASHVERELSGGQPSPGAVVPVPNAMHRAADFAEELHLRPEKSKTGWFLSIVTTFVLASLAYLALTQDRIVLGGKRGESVYEGMAATVVGFALLAVAFFSLWRLSARTRFARALGCSSVALWLLFVFWFILAR
ncbi:MAG: hypothetical protein IBJ14_07875 [Hydrogenophaga sp.]|nr:hypothetical protein [Hydrogenophaga sp.]